jgi:hypothetical protein
MSWRDWASRSMRSLQLPCRWYVMDLPEHDMDQVCCAVCHGVPPASPPTW